MTPIAKGDPVELRELLAKAAPGILSADTHHAKDHAGRTHGFIRSEGELVPLGAIVLGVEGMPQDQGRARLALIVAAVNKLPALLDRIETLEKVLEPFARAARDLADGRSVWVERPINDTGELRVEHFQAVLSALTNQGDPE